MVSIYQELPEKCWVYDENDQVFEVVNITVPPELIRNKEKIIFTAKECFKQYGVLPNQWLMTADQKKFQVIGAHQNKLYVQNSLHKISDLHLATKEELILAGYTCQPLTIIDMQLTLENTRKKVHQFSQGIIYDSKNVLLNTSTLLKETDTHDVKFKVEGQIVSAHRFYLMHCSNYFKSLLSKKYKENNLIKNKQPIALDCTITSFNLLINYFYTGSITINESNIIEIAQLASQYQIPKLEQYCCQIMPELFNQNKENIFPCFEALFFQGIPLTQVINDYMYRNADHLFQLNSSVYLLSKEALLCFLENNQSQQLKMGLVKAVVFWTKDCSLSTIELNDFLLRTFGIFEKQSKKMCAFYYVCALEKILKDEKIEDKLNKALTINTVNISFLLVYAKALFNLRKYHSLIAICRKILENDNKNLDCLQIYVSALLDVADYRCAKLFCEKALEINPENKDFSLLLCKILFKQKKYYEAKLICDKIFTTKSNHCEFLNIYISILYKLKSFEKAESFCRKKMYEHSMDLKDSLRYANILIKTKKIAEAQHTCRRLLTYRNGYSRSELYKFAKTLYKLKNYIPARVIFEEALYLGRDPHILRKYAETLYHLKDYEKAKLICDEVFKIDLLESYEEFVIRMKKQIMMSRV